MTLTLEQTARTIYYLKVARQRLASRIVDAEVYDSQIELEYRRLDELILLFNRYLESFE